MSNVKTMHTVKSVALTCDFLRAQPGPEGFVNFQFKNLAWLKQIIGAQSTWQQWGVKTSVIVAPSHTLDFQYALGNDTVFSNYLHDADQTWASLYDADELQVFPENLKQLFENDLIVGFELPPTLKKALDKAGKTYISFYIHPFRFLRDLCFFVTTNSADIASLIAQDAVNIEEIDYQARRFRALFSRLEHPALSLPNDLPVLIGQTCQDSVLIRNGQFTTWEDYEDKLAETLAPYSEIIFLEHPYNQNSALHTEYFRGRHGKTVISARGNSYGVIFSQINSPFFLTLASSLGAEARCAGQKCIFLSNDPCEKFILDGIDIPTSAMVSHAALKDEFWQNIFSSQFQNRKQKTGTASLSFSLGDNFIRNSLDSWAFRPLQSGKFIDPVLKRILPAATATDERILTVSKALCGGASGALRQMLIHGRTEQSWGSIETLAKPIATGVEIDFTHSSAAHYLVQGFHAPEGWGVWSSGKYAKLILPIHLADFTSVQLEISMVVKAFPGILVHAPVLQIMMSGKEVGIVLFRKSAKNEQHIHFTAYIDNPVCEIYFLISHTGSPALLNQSTDHRELGFGLCALSIDFSSPKGEKNSTAEISGKFWGVSQDETVDDVEIRGVEGGIA